jgi:hypothetical protein
LKDLNVFICEAIVVIKEKMMKKTSLMLAIGALLYGAAGSYAFADDVTLSPEMSPEAVNAFLDTIPPPAEENVIPENAPALDQPGGLDPAQALPGNVSIVNNTVIKKPAMCSPSFQVNGAEMAGILVTVTFGDGSTQSGRWIAGIGTRGYASGTGWILAEMGDTWSGQWMLFTAKDVSIKKIVIHALDVKPGKGRVYAFDVGGKLPRAPANAAPEHTPGSARGQFINQTVPTTPRIFTATYTDPVYTNAHGTTPPSKIDSTAIPLIPPYGTGDPHANRVPKHDLYGTLTIDFITPPPPTPPTSTAIGSATPIGVIDFAYIADTDCLPVKEAKVSSYQGGMVNFTLIGDGSAYIAERCGASSNLIAGPFVVAYSQGAVGFSTSLTPQSGCCYSVVNIADDGTENTVPLLGVNTNTDNEVCP